MHKYRNSLFWNYVIKIWCEYICLLIGIPIWNILCSFINALSVTFYETWHVFSYLQVSESLYRDVTLSGGNPLAECIWIYKVIFVPVQL